MLTSLQFLEVCQCESRCAKRAVAIQLDCFVPAHLLVMTVCFLRDVG